MFQRALSLFIAFAFVGSASALAAPAKLSDKPIGAEVQFVQSIQKDLTARFPTAAAATAAGYTRYTNEDNTGAISYANLHWSSSDPKHPSQLWYDVNGNLLGADFSVLQKDSPAKPKLWGINAQRWQDFNAHIHYVLKDADGKPSYGATSGKKFIGAGGDVNNPTAAALVKLGRVKAADAVQTVFVFPKLWDLIVWVKPNPNGAFADKNPLVHPSPTAEKDSM
ncbi:MAG: hypothetical protein M3Y21_00210 [Candidatus Eremiobacteraeota bacterium]|nr:hypothetical protein [Candidatus Eremiobacteraeota bacterium]